MNMFSGSSEATPQVPEESSATKPESQFAGGTLASPDYHAKEDEKPVQPFSWQAAEYVHHPKSTAWVVGFVIVALILFAVAFVIGSWTFMALVVVMASAAAYYAFRKPGILEYTIDRSSIQINGKPYSLHDFRAYGAVPSEHGLAIMLIPAKRLGLALRLLATSEESEQILPILSRSLPVQEMHEDPVDRILRNIRF